MKILTLVLLFGFLITVIAWAYKLRRYKGGGMIVPKDYSQRVAAGLIKDLSEIRESKDEL